MKPTISVIVPVYNGAPYISQTVDSILRQEGYPPDEVIVIDDGSTDQTPLVLSKYEGRIIYRRIPNSGVAEARNKGLEISTGQLIAFCDHDDLWFKDKLKKQVGVLTKYPDVGLCCSNFMELLDGSGKNPLSHFERLHGRRQLNFDAPLKADPCRALIREHFIGTVSNVVMRRKVMEKVGWFDPRFVPTDEYDYWLRCARVTNFLLLSEVLVYKKVHKNNVSHDRILLYTKSKQIFQDLLTSNGSEIRDQELREECKLALARHSYKLGDEYYEAGDRRKAFALYRRGMTEACTPGNLARFSWKVAKKTVRLITGDFLCRQSIRKWRMRLGRIRQGNPVKISWKEADRKIQDLFLDDSYSAIPRYGALFRYLVSGFLFYRTPDGSHACYPGEGSYHGTQVDHMEGCTRILPLIGAWIHSGRSALIEGGNVECADLKEIVRKGLLAGTDPKSKGYWGPIGDFDQRAHEAADVALTLWFLRNSIWKEMGNRERERVIAWLVQVNGRKITDNNWHHIPVVVNKVLQSLGYDWDEGLVQRHYARWKSFYRGDGWFSDGPGGVFDYYNAWGMNYTLFWIGEMDPDFDPEFIRESRKAFLGSYKYFLAPSGIPIMGRSICYRMAAAAPLIAGALKSPEVVSPGLGRRALDCLWRHFIAKGALAEGNVTQGYWKKNLRFLDNYCGPASGLWALRSLILAFYSPDKSPLWQDPEELLPVEKGDYEVRIPTLGWTLLGRQSSGEVKLVIQKNNPGKRVRIRSYTWFDHLKGILRGRPNRPENRMAAYGLRQYSSLHPFCEDPEESPGKAPGSAWRENESPRSHSCSSPK